MSKATVLGPDEGEKYWIAGDHITFKVGPQQTDKKYAVALTWTAPGSGPPPHIHANEDEMFYIIEGTMMFMDNQETFIGGPGTAVYLKKGIPHTFKNVGDKPAKFIVTTAPTGFEAFVAECGESITQIPCDKQVNDAAIGKLMANCGKYGVTILPEHKVIGEKAHVPKQRNLWVLGHLITIKLGAEDTAGNFSVVEIMTRPGLFVPAHKHLNMEEYFYVTEGEFKFTIGDKTLTATPGTFIHVPRNVMHGFENKTSAPAKMVDFHTPGGFEKFFEECGSPCHDINETPPEMPASVEQLAMMFRKHGMNLKE